MIMSLTFMSDSFTFLGYRYRTADIKDGLISYVNYIYVM